MGKAIIIGLVIVALAILAAGVIVHRGRQQERQRAREKGWALKGDLTRIQEARMLQLLTDADALMATMLTPDMSALDMSDFLSQASKDRITQWRGRYQSERNKLSA